MPDGETNLELHSPDEIVEQHPEITLAYFWDHRIELEDAIVRERSFADELRKKTASPLMEIQAATGPPRAALVPAYPLPAGQRSTRKTPTGAFRPQRNAPDRGSQLP